MFLDSLSLSLYPVCFPEINESEVSSHTVLADKVATPKGFDDDSFTMPHPRKLSLSRRTPRSRDPCKYKTL